MGSIELERLFSRVIEYGKYVRQTGIDGLAAWKNIKNDFSLDIKLEDWVQERKMYPTLEVISGLENIFNYVHDELKMYGDDDDEQKYSISKHEWQVNHFLLQLARIPKNSKIDLVRLMQVAYNIGQYYSSHEEYSNLCATYFELNLLSLVHSYVDLTRLILADHETSQIKKLQDKIFDLTQKIKQTNKKGGSKNNIGFYSLKWNNISF